MQNAIKNIDSLMVYDPHNTEYIKFKTDRSKILPKLKLEVEIFLSCTPNCS